MNIEQARSVYEGQTMVDRWSIARAVHSTDHPVVRQAAREELETLIEETTGQAGSHRIHAIARKHIANLRDHSTSIATWDRANQQGATA